MEIGWREWAALPELDVERIKVKIDTGAKTSAIHAFNIRETDHDGVLYAEFVLHPEQRRAKPAIKCTAPIIDRRAIKSSNGMVQERLIIRTALVMGERSWPIDLSLTNRDEMDYRMLVGRDALRKNIIIRPGKSFLLGA
ncbi:MAG: RimK/LysX family protein [Parvularculaceae bacterium]